MKLFAPTVIVVSSLFLGNTAGEIPSFAHEVPEIRSGPPVFTFNGKDLAGFSKFTRFHRQEDPDGVFGVEQGAIHISGREFGGLATVGSYADYHLIAEWRWGGRTWSPGGLVRGTRG